MSRHLIHSLFLGVFILLSACQPDRKTTRQLIGDSAVSNAEESETMDFMVQAMDQETPRQGGQHVNIYVIYRYSSSTENIFPDYRKIRETCLSYLKEQPGLPLDVQWEAIARKMAREIKHSYPISAISVMWQTHPNPTSDGQKPSEPGFHSAIFTIGDIQPLAIPGSMTSKLSSDSLD